MSLTSPAEGATSLVAGRSTGRLRRVAAGAEPKPPMSSRRSFGGHLGETFTNMNAQILFTPLTKDELASLEWISVVATPVVRPIAHIEKLLATGYVQESASGLVLTDIGVWRLDREQAKKKPT